MALLHHRELYAGAEVLPGVVARRGRCGEVQQDPEGVCGLVELERRSAHGVRPQGGGIDDHPAAGGWKPRGSQVCTAQIHCAEADML